MEEKEVARLGDSLATPPVENCLLFTLAYKYMYIQESMGHDTTMYMYMYM